MNFFLWFWLYFLAAVGEGALWRMEAATASTAAALFRGCHRVCFFRLKMNPSCPSQ
jgi:hypothetical protein